MTGRLVSWSLQRGSEKYSGNPVGKMTWMSFRFRRQPNTEIPPRLCFSPEDSGTYGRNDRSISDRVSRALGGDAFAKCLGQACLSMGVVALSVTHCNWSISFEAPDPIKSCHCRRNFLYCVLLRKEILMTKRNEVGKKKIIITRWTQLRLDRLGVLRPWAFLLRFLCD